MLFSLRQDPILPKGETPPPQRQQPFTLSAAPKRPQITSTPSSRLNAVPSDLPDFYRENSFWAIARDPYCIFLYWQLALPVTHIRGLHLALAITREETNTIEAVYNVESPAGSRLIPVSMDGTPYRLALGFVPEGCTDPDAMRCVFAHRTIFTPRDQPISPAKTPSPPRARIPATRPTHSTAISSPSAPPPPTTTLLVSRAKPPPFTILTLSPALPSLVPSNGDAIHQPSRSTLFPARSSPVKHAHQPGYPTVLPNAAALAREFAGFRPDASSYPDSETTPPHASGQ